MAKQPLTWILACSFVLFTVGLWWGLPHNESWLSDDLAPYHPLVGLAQGFSFSYMHKYPLVHQLILALLNIPVVIVALVQSNPLEGLQFLKFIALLRTPSYGTALMVIDRFVSVFMALGIIYWMYRSALELFNRRVALITAAIIPFNTVLNLYAHLSKNEVPYMFWAVLSLYVLIKAVKYGRTKDYVYAALFSCLSYGTKDQAYAIFIFPFIVYLFVHPLLFRESASSRLSTVFNKRNGVFAVSFIVFTLITQNIVLNWEGFLYRLSLLTGSAKDSSMAYELSCAGLWAHLSDNTINFARAVMGPPMALLMLAGSVFFVARQWREKALFSLQSIFLLATLSYYLFFMLIIRQSSPRFLLPLGVFLAVYGAFLVDRVIPLVRGRRRLAAAALAGMAMIYSGYHVISVNAEMLLDLRYKVEDWMHNNLPENVTMEYYAYLHYLPRFPETVRSYRIKSGVSDIEMRRPDYIIITSHFYPRFFGGTDYVVEKGRIVNFAKNIRYRQSDFPDFYEALLTGSLPNYGEEARFVEGDRRYKKTSFSRISPKMIIIYKRKSGAP